MFKIEVNTLLPMKWCPSAGARNTVTSALWMPPSTIVDECANLCPGESDVMRTTLLVGSNYGWIPWSLTCND